MAVSNFWKLQAFPAAKDIAETPQSKHYAKAVVLDSTGKATAVHTAGAAILGVIVEGLGNSPLPDTDPHLTLGVCTERGAKVPVRTGGVVPAGATLSVDVDGRFIAQSGTAIGVAVATEAAAAADLFITAVLI